MGLRDKMRRLERAAEGEMVVIPQADGTVKRFPFSDLEAAFINECRRLRVEDVPVHSLTLAASNSSDPEWFNSGFAEMHVSNGKDVEDLSE